MPFSSLLYPRRWIAQLYLFAVSHFNHRGADPLPAVTYSGWADGQNGTVRLLIRSPTFSFLINYEVSPASSAGLPKAPRGSCRLPNRPPTSEILSPSSEGTFPAFPYPKPPKPQSPATFLHVWLWPFPTVETRFICLSDGDLKGDDVAGVMRGHDSSQLDHRGDLDVLSSVVPQTVRRVGARQIRLYIRSLPRGFPGLPLKR